MSKDDLYDLHLKRDERREFGVPDPQFKLGSSWLVGIEASFARVSVGVGMLVEVAFFCLFLHWYIVNDV